MSGHIFGAIGVNPAVIKHAYLYALLYYISCGFQTQFDCYRQYLNSTNQSFVVKYAVIFSFAVHVVLLLPLASFLDLGMLGVGLAAILTSFNCMAFVMVYVWRFSPNPVIPFLSASWPSLMKTESVRGHLGLAISSVSMVCATWWAIELL